MSRETLSTDRSEDIMNKVIKKKYVKNVIKE